MEERGFQQAPDRIRVFRDIAEALNQANDISAAMEAILPMLGDALGLETAWAFRFDEHKRSFVEVGASGLPPALDECQQARLRTGWCECQDQFVEGKLGEAVNIVRCSRLKSAVGDTGNLHFHASIPLRSKGNSLGILNLAAPGRTVFDEAALAFLQTVGQQVAVAVDRARLFQQVRDKATRLQQLAEIAAAWVRTTPPQTLLQRALESFVEKFGYAACGVTSDNAGSAEIVAVAEAKPGASEDEGAYVYTVTTAEETDNQAPPAADCDSILLALAYTAVSTPLPLTAYELRLESPLPNAFSAADQELLDAFAWQLAAAYAGADAHVQAMRHAYLEERHRIAAELHDSVSQRLFSAQLLLRTATAQMELQSPDAEVTVARVGQLLSESQQEMRDLVRALRRLDDETSLLADLQARISTLAMQPKPKVELVLSASTMPEPAPFVRATLLAIVDEALHNALKHANAQSIRVLVDKTDDNLLITVVDDGIGCPLVAIGRGLGTRTMVERAAAIGGTVAIDGQPGRGTRVVIDIPYGASGGLGK
ncbi:GAF domain-containing sensor histidine kinase [Alicyclobacillus sp. ALC3]|uniref:GAF domain-containing sensor histidine kinase n=1 Tax=Alicyclobacillus sp. ALC3 TaxID=2796143 RepID=UPI0023782173|nr:GAF domain-containing sensor histidine kinase [Alicyclobacillus sp. ALC3]WDL99119.1 GAF domain-containing sensor histidine kinase [Alicyclobacillus sp. ALC3]